MQPVSSISRNRCGGRFPRHSRLNHDCAVVLLNMEEGSIHKGRVSRIEPYGAFVQLERATGLVHISQLSHSHVDQVTDVVAVGDEVWTRILEINDGKIRLTLKDIPQDGSAPQMAQSASLSRSMEQNLTSKIGMGLARDPMAGASSNLILKGQSSQTLINGYALVGDDEGEPPAPVNPVVPPPVAAPTRPMGRGRGTTLPAWMTQKDDPLGTKSDSDDSKDRKRKKKKHSSKKHKKSKKKHRKREYYSSDDDSRRRKKRKRRRHESSDESTSK